VAAAVALAAAAAVLLTPSTALEVRHQETGRLLWRVPIASGERVDLNYTNSLFDAPTTERYVIDGSHLHLEMISSTKEAVLEYLSLDPPFEQHGDRFVARLSGPRFAELTIRIGQTGRQRLDIEGLDVPLYQVGTGDAVRLQIARPRRAEILLARPQAP